MATWEEITQSGTPQRNWKIKEWVAFHYFNPAGLYNQKKIVDEKISAAVSAGIMKPGAILAYGSLADFGTEALVKLFRTKRVSEVTLHLTLKMIEREIAAAETALEKAKLES